MKQKFLAFLVVVTAAALLAVGAAQAGMTTTKHNLSYTGPGTIKASNGQQANELCIWCHTPHAANVSFTGSPLWNKATPSQTYTMYGTTIAGTSTDAQPNASSMACLSCHDGVSAINSLVNDSSGNVYSSATGSNVAFGVTPAGTAYPMPGTSNSNLGTNLQNDHPVSITYTAGKASLVPTTTAFGTATIAALLRNNKVECASCHDPHVAAGDTTAQGTVAGTYFLREANAGSVLCIACHAK